MERLPSIYHFLGATLLVDKTVVAGKYPVKSPKPEVSRYLEEVARLKVK